MEKENIKIAFISDLHYSLADNHTNPERCGQQALAILDRAVSILNHDIRPDLVLVGGDVINIPDGEDAEELTAALAATLGKLLMPCTVIRGNHDMEQERFVKSFPFRRVTDVSFVRIVAFDDRETPGYNAERSEEDIRFMENVETSGRLVFSFQHTPLTPPGSCIYSYDNAGKMLSLMREKGWRGALSGHYHAGIGLMEEEGLQFFVQSALCEKPFAMSILTVGRSGIEAVEKIQLPVE